MALFLDESKPVFTCVQCGHEYNLLPSEGWNDYFCTDSCAFGYDLREKLSGVIHDAAKEGNGKISYGAVADRVLEGFKVSIKKMRRGPLKTENTT